MALGPVDVHIIAFPGNQFSGEIVPAILEQVELGVIRVLDVLFVSKDAAGDIAIVTIEDLGPDGAAFVGLELAHVGALNAEDADEIAEDLPANSSALLIAFENTWMREIIGAFARAGAMPINQIRIPASVVNELSIA